MLYLLFCLLGEKLGSLGGWTYYTVQARGNMTSGNVKKTCEAHGFITPCAGPEDCSFSGPQCTVTSFTKCGNSMSELSRSICDGQNPNNCPKLYDVFIYMNNYGRNGACGGGPGWCKQGSNFSNKMALCAKKD